VIDGEERRIKELPRNVCVCVCTEINVYRKKKRVYTPECRETGVKLIIVIYTRGNAMFVCV